MNTAWSRPAGQVLSACFGVLCSLALWHGLHAPRLPRLPSATKVSVLVRQAPAPIAPAAQSKPIINNAILPLRGQFASLRKSTTKLSPPIVQPLPTDSPTVEPVLPTVEAPDAFATIGPPQQYAQPQRPAQDLPAIVGADAPPVPAEPQAFSLTQVIKPGGSILVLGVLLDDSSRAVNAKVLVPSANSLGDVTHAMAHIGRQWSDISPPMQPGEQRWIELRIDNTPNTSLDDQLP